MTFRTRPFEAKPVKSPGTSDYCCVRCRRDLDPAKPVYWIHLIEGGYSVLHPDDEEIFNATKTPEEEAGDLYSFPIGNDCAKIVGLEFTFLQEPVQAPRP